jgi:hypothetical protein
VPLIQSGKGKNLSRSFCFRPFRAAPRNRNALVMRLNTLGRGTVAFLPPKHDSTTAFGSDFALLRIAETPREQKSRREWS